MNCQMAMEMGPSTARGSAVGDRDQRYSAQFTEFTARLQTLATMDDLPKIRDSLLPSAHELRAGVNRMAQDGEVVVTQMRGQLRQYQAKLEEAERLASVDSLTGLAEPAEDRSGVGIAGGAGAGVFGDDVRFERIEGG
jgi:hypothetical protein